MRRSAIYWLLIPAGWFAAGAGRAEAQVSLADDIILATKGEEEKEKAQQTTLGRPPGAPSPLFGSGGTGLEEAPEMHSELAEPRAETAPGPEAHRIAQRGRERSAGPGIQGRRILPSPALPSSAAVGFGQFEFIDEDIGPPGGLTLDQAIDRLVAANLELRTKFHEIPMARADLLSAGLRANPLLFYDSSGVPYGSYSTTRPGEVEHGISIVYPIDYNNKRRARERVAEAAIKVLEAQYQNAVRLEIDDLYTVFVDVLDARDGFRSARRSVEVLDGLLADARRSGDAGAVDDILLVRETTAMLAANEARRLRRTKEDLAALLSLPPAMVDRLDPSGSLRDLGPAPPPVETLIQIALCRRPDVVAHRLGVRRSVAEVRRAKAERLSDAYLLYSPMGYRDNRLPGERDINTWGAGVFVTVPLYDRNQGNVRRTQVLVSRSQTERAALERQVITEVRQAFQEYAGTLRDLDHIAHDLRPIALRKRNRAREQYQAGTLDAAGYLSAQQSYTVVARHYRDLRVRHRRSMLDLNTAVGVRVLP